MHNSESNYKTLVVPQHSSTLLCNSDNHFYHFVNDTKPYTGLFETPEIGYEWHLDDFMDYKPYCTTLNDAKYEVNELNLDWTNEMEKWFDENGDIIHENCSVYEAARKFYCTFCIKRI